MTIRTRIEVDVTGLSAQIDAIKNKLGEITTAARGGEYKLNTQQAERDVGHLLRQLDKLEVLRDSAARHDELLPGQSQDMARVYRQAANAINRVNRQSGANEPVDWLRTAADEQAKAAEATEPGHGTRQRRQSQYELIADGADKPFSPVPPTEDGRPSVAGAPTPNNAKPLTAPVDEQLNLSRERVSFVQNIIGGDNFRRMDAGGIPRLDNKQAQRGIDELAAQYDALEKAKKRQGDLSIEQAKRLAAIYRDIAKAIDAINRRYGLTQTAAEPIRKAATTVLNPPVDKQQPPPLISKAITHS